MYNKTSLPNISLDRSNFQANGVFQKKASQLELSLMLLSLLPISNLAAASLVQAQYRLLETVMGDQNLADYSSMQKVSSSSNLASTQLKKHKRACLKSRARLRGPVTKRGWRVVEWRKVTTLRFGVYPLSLGCGSGGLTCPFRPND
ncbi:Uncharacterized protein TCM_031467 [Theobroma cacao]|uniref:Uncharacterized protein n=1 Tax=Theobroma cacao TaxID=3641 RepID=A0A061F6G4_THECC|nr:Uncharacterized protein TCM_031467 [Theobroma cacao]